MTTEPLYLIDASGFVFRAFHALPGLTRSDGTPVGAVLGFCNMLVRLLVESNATKLAVIHDAARRNFRNDFYPDYKANRTETPPELIPQFPLIRRAATAFGLPNIELDGYEADDLIATYAKLAESAGQPVIVVSSDKDLMQLVRPGVSLLDPIKNRPIGEAEVFEKFGVHPSKVIDVQSLAGDAVDNVPGVPGIGVKTAAQLIDEYGDLDTLLARAHEIKQPKRRESLIAHAEAARVSRRLVTLAEDAPTPLALDALNIEKPDAATVMAFCDENGFKSLRNRMAQWLGGEGLIGEPTPFGAPAAAPEHPAPAAPAAVALGPIARDAIAVTELGQLDAVIAAARALGRVAIDTETDSLVPATATLVGISLATDESCGFYIPLSHVTGEGGLFGHERAPNQLDKLDVLNRLQPLLEDPSILKIGHNFKFDWQIFKQNGIDVGPVDDTMLMSYAAQGGHGHGMDDLSAKLLGHQTIKYADVAGTGKNQLTFDRVAVDKATAYAAEDAAVTFGLHKTLKPQLLAERRMTVYETVDRPLVQVVARMEMNGVRVDPAVLSGLSSGFGARLAVLEAEIQEMAGHSFNLASPRQLGQVLFDELGLTGGEKTKTGDWSTHADILDTISGQHPIVQKILDWRGLAKLRNTYTDTLPQQIQPATGRIHTAFSLAATSTGRMSSTDPNLQNIPIRTEDGRLIRTAFVASPGHVVLSADYSQIELRLVAALADIPALKTAFRTGADIHRLTAAQILGVPEAEVTADQRRSAKAINFGIIYGISGWGLAQQIGSTPMEASAYIKTYFERFPELRRYMEAVKQEARTKGYVDTLFGRKCPIPYITDRNPSRRAGAERQAINAPVQGTAADIIRRAMAAVDAMLIEENAGTRMLLQVHDELVFEVPEAEAAAMPAKIARCMERVALLDVPLVVETGIGQSWAAAH